MPSNTGPAPRPSPSPPRPLSLGTVTRLLIIATLTALCYPLLSTGLAFAPPFQFAALRAGVAGLALLLVALALRRPFPKGWRVLFMIALAGLSNTTLGFMSMFSAAGLIAPGIAAVIAGTQPIVSALIALVLFGQPFGKRQMAGMTIALAGIAAITSRTIAVGGSNAALGAGLVVTATFGVALGNALTKRFAAEVDPVVAAATQLVVGAIPLAVLALLSEPPTPAVLEPRFLLGLAVLALGGTALSFVLWIAVLRHNALNRVNAFEMLAPVLGFGISVAFLGQPLMLAAVIGMGLVLGGVGLAAKGG